MPSLLREEEDKVSLTVSEVHLVEPSGFNAKTLNLSRIYIDVYGSNKRQIISSRVTQIYILL